MIHHGDCLEVLKSLPSDSVDALVTDPPAGISFMGKAVVPLQARTAFMMLMGMEAWP